MSIMEYVLNSTMLHVSMKIALSGRDSINDNNSFKFKRIFGKNLTKITRRIKLFYVPLYVYI